MIKSTVKTFCRVAVDARSRTTFGEVSPNLTETGRLPDGAAQKTSKTGQHARVLSVSWTPLIWSHSDILTITNSHFPQWPSPLVLGTYILYTSTSSMQTNRPCTSPMSRVNECMKNVNCFPISEFRTKEFINIDPNRSRTGSEPFSRFSRKPSKRPRSSCNRCRCLLATSFTLWIYDVCIDGPFVLIDYFLTMVNQ